MSRVESGGRIRDPLAVYNERVKLAAGLFNAIGSGLLSFAVLRPITEDMASLDRLSAAWEQSGSAGDARRGTLRSGSIRKEADHG